MPSTADEPPADPVAVDRYVLMAVGLIGIGLLLYLGFESEPNRTDGDGVRGRLSALATLVSQHNQAR